MENYSSHITSPFAILELEYTEENEEKYVRKYEVEVFTKDINADIIKKVYESR